MAIHMSVRLAWHDNGWNGHICQKPRENSYCVGQSSYPGDLIASNRDLNFENRHCGEACKNFPCQVACGLSEYDNDKRRVAAERYFNQFEAGKSLIFYYANYSNPFSENEEKNFVVVGISRLKEIAPFQFYPDANDWVKENFADGLVWQRPITSNYPDEGFCIPYQNYMGDEDALNKILVKPTNRAPFKYASREVSNDDAIEVINQLLIAVDALIALGDTSQDWNVRKTWLNSVLAEIWRARGPYPGFPAVLKFLKLEPLISDYVNLADYADMKKYIADVRAFLDGANNAFAQKFSSLNKIRRNCLLLGAEKLNLLFNVLSRFALTAAQVNNLMGDDRANFSVTATVADMLENPYTIFEQYVGSDSEDTIPLYKIDNGVIPSPQYGIIFCQSRDDFKFRELAA